MKKAPPFFYGLLLLLCCHTPATHTMNILTPQCKSPSPPRVIPHQHNVFCKGVSLELLKELLEKPDQDNPEDHVTLTPKQRAKIVQAIACKEKNGENKRKACK